ncbi:MAG: alanine--tRNA ligase-related protein [Promethearchaeota archaeon]
MSKKLYWEKPYETTFEATITGKTKNGIILDQTLFYPQGGGQKSDKGILKFKGNKIKVSEVIAKEKEIVHKISKQNLKDFKVGQKVIGKIDWQHRYALMKAHTAQHLISALLKEDFGIDTEQAYIEPNKVILHLKQKFRHENLIHTFRKANIFSTIKNFKVKTILSEKEKIRKNFTHIRGDIPDVEQVRLIQMEEIDLICCGGTHLKNTKEIGPLFLFETKTQNEIKFNVGEEAINQIVKLNMENIEISKNMNIQLNEIAKKVSELGGKNTLLMKENQELKLSLLDHIFKKPRFSLKKIDIFCLDFSIEYKLIQKKLDELPENSILIAFFDEDKVRIVSKVQKLSANDLIQQIVLKYEGKGGGSNFNAQAYIPNRPKEFRREIFDLIKDIIKKEVP